MKISSSLVAIFALHVLASGIAAQSPAPEITLSKPDAEFAEPFSEIASIRELRDGRVIVVDTRERVLKLVDFGRTSASMIGHKGAGPGEYRAPLSVSRGGGPMKLLGPAIQGVTSGRYRGSFDLYPGAVGGVTAINAVPIDDYVQGHFFSNRKA